MSECLIEPIGGRVIVKPAEMSSSTLILPPDSKEKVLFEGHVVEVADDVEKLKVGDYIHYGRYVGAKIEGTEFYILNEADVWGKKKNGK